MTKREFAIFLLVGVALYIGFGLLVGCNAPQKDQAAILVKDVENLGVALAALETRVATSQQATAGRDVEQRSSTNEPWTGRILAAGFAAIPLSFLAYMAIHRSPLARKVIDKIKGKPNGVH